MESKPTQQRKRPAAIATVLSGALSGAVISACVQPLDVLRTRMQADAAAGSLRSTGATLKLVLTEGGPRALWRGTGPTVWRLSVGVGLNMLILERLKAAMLQHMGSPSSGLGAWQAALVGGASRALAAAVMSPVTLVKTRMECTGPSARQYRSTAHALASIARAEGVGGLFRGLGPTVLTNAPFSALYYMMYTDLKRRLAGDERPAAAVNFASGVCAAVVATLLTQPTDVVRTRMQLGLAGGAAGGGGWGTLAHVIRSQGPQALLTGAAPRVLKRTVQTALVWTLYEELLPRLTALTQLSAHQAAPQNAAGG